MVTDGQWQLPVQLLYLNVRDLKNLPGPSLSTLRLVPCSRPLLLDPGRRLCPLSAPRSALGPCGSRAWCTFAAARGTTERALGLASSVLVSGPVELG